MLEFIDVFTFAPVPNNTENDGKKFPMGYGLWVNRKKHSGGLTEQEAVDIQKWITDKGVTLCPPAYGTGSTGELSAEALAFHKSRNGGLNAIDLAWSKIGEKQAEMNRHRIEKRVERLRAKYAELRRQKEGAA